MTGTLLALLAGDGTVRLDDPVGKWLDAGPNGAITLRQLASHTSGLPEAAPNYDSASVDPLNPWAGFGAETAQEGLQQAKTQRPGEPGAFLYSNFGYQLLGLILERASGSPYPQLIAGRLFDPLGISGAGVGAEGPGILLAGHGEDGQPRPPRDYALPGAGGVTMTIADLAQYARACLSPPPGAVGAAIITAQRPQVEVDEGRSQALGWIVTTDGRIVKADGNPGSSSYMVIDSRHGRAIALAASRHGLAGELTEAANAALGRR